MTRDQLAERVGRLEDRVAELEAYKERDQTEKSVATKAGRVVLSLIGTAAAILAAVVVLLTQD